MKCAITKSETTRMTKSIPLSRGGKQLLVIITKAYNEKLEENFKAGVRASEEKEGKIPMSDELLSKLAPKVSSHKVLKAFASDNLSKDLKACAKEVLEVLSGASTAQGSVNEA